MASFAKLDENNVVVQIDKLNDVVIQDENGVEQESLGIAFLRNHYNEPDAKWVQTSYNTVYGEHTNGGTPLRMNYASIGGTYDPDKDIFIGTKPHPAYVGPTDSGTWDPPIPNPTVTNYTENGESYAYMWQLDGTEGNYRWLGSKKAQNPVWNLVWNSSTSSWDPL